MNKLVFSILFLLELLFATPINARPKVGDMAPPIKLTALLQASGTVEKNINSLKGKVVVLEFWATWCAPCIKAMPHLNELSKKYKDKGVQFISITDESVEKTVSFLKKRSINGWVGLDGNKALMEAYGINSLPFTIVIGADGIILGYPDRKTVSEAMLDQALVGQLFPSSIDSVQTVAPIPVEVKLTEPLYELSIRPSNRTVTSSYIGIDFSRVSGAPALDVIKIAFDAALKHTELHAALPNGVFDVVATKLSKNSPDWSWRTQLQQLVQNVWNIRVHHEQKVMDVYELTASATVDKRLTKADPTDKISRQSSEEGILVGRNTSIDILCKNIQDELGEPVLNATNLNGNYDYNLYFEDHKPETLIKAIEEETGLTLRKVKRTIDVLMIVPGK